VINVEKKRESEKDPFSCCSEEEPSYTRIGREQVGDRQQGEPRRSKTSGRRFDLPCSGKKKPMVPPRSGGRKDKGGGKFLNGGNNPKRGKHKNS